MHKPKSPLQRAVSSARLLLDVAAGGASIATVLGFAASMWWIFELLQHARAQYCLILVSALVVGGISRRAWSFVWCIPLLLNLALIVPLFFSSGRGSYPEQANLPQSRTLRIIHATLDNQNLDTTRAIQYIESQDVDLILLLEITSRSLSDLESSLSRYRVVASEPRENSHGSAMLLPVKPSKPVEVAATQILHLPHWSERPMLQATIRWGGKDVEILSIQLTRPQNSGGSAFQKIEFDAAANWLVRQQKEGKREVIAIGDFNSTPWSGWFREFLHDADLRNSQQGFGLQPTWHSALPSPLRIAIDHCLHSKSITTVNRAIGPNIGSDHLPIFVELGL